MKAYDFAELFLNTGGQRGEKELREYVAIGGDINEKNRDGMSAMDAALDTTWMDKAGREVAPQLVLILKSLINGDK